MTRRAAHATLLHLLVNTRTGRDTPPPMLLLLMFACPKTGGPLDAADHRVTPEPAAPAVCISAVQEAGPIGPELGRWQQAVTLLESGDVAGARAQLDPGSHPALQAAMVASYVLDDDVAGARRELLPLLDAWPQDGCLNETATWIYLGLNRIDLAQNHARAALTANPESINAHFLSATVDLQRTDSDGAASKLRQVLQKEPEHVGANLMLGAIYVGKGDNLLALPLLEKAQAGGADASQWLAPSYYGAGRMADYLRMADQAGWPLGPAAGIADAEDPLAAYNQALGVPEGGMLEVSLETSLGTIQCVLFHEQAPVTVANFVGLAEGTQPWTLPDGSPGEGRFYDGTRFHRVISGFMIQGGDPLSKDDAKALQWGTGGPGYAFPDELTTALSFDRPGRLAMANSGPGTNGSQFFVMDGATPYLDGKHTIFGQCAPASLIAELAAQPTGSADRPTQPLTLHHVHVQR